ncbi:MAG: O-antigen ligase family protein [Minisyncoccales bacterium]
MNLLYTKSRGAWLGFLAALFSVFIINKKRKYLVVLLLILMISFYVLPSEYINRFESSINVTDNRSNLGRLALWKGSLFMLRDNPLRGVGAGNFQEKYAGEYRQPNTTTTVHAHNNLLHFTAEAGILGLFTFIFLMYSILKVLVKGLKQVEDKNWYLFLLSGVGAFIVFNIQGLTEFNFGDTEPLHFFFFLMALNMIVIKIFTDKKINQKKVDN